MEIFRGKRSIEQQVLEQEREGEGVEGGNMPKGCLNGREGWATGALQGDRSCHLTTYMGTQQTMSDLQRRLNVNVSDNLVLNQSKRPRGQ